MFVLSGCQAISMIHVNSEGSYSLLSPLVFTADLILLLGSKVILDVEGLADLLWGLSLDHVGDSFAANVKQSFDVEIVGSLHSPVSPRHRSKGLGNAQG